MPINEKKLKDILDKKATSYPLRIPKGVNKPCIVYKRVGTYRKQDMKNETVFQRNRFQVDIYAKSYSGAKTLSNSVISALLAEQDVIYVENTFDSNDDSGDTPNLYRVTIDVFLYGSD